MTSQPENSTQSSDTVLQESFFSDGPFSFESFLHTATPQPVHTCCCNNEAHIKRQNEIIKTVVDRVLESRGHMMRRGIAAGKLFFN